MDPTERFSKQASEVWVAERTSEGEYRTFYMKHGHGPPVSGHVLKILWPLIVLYDPRCDGRHIDDAFENGNQYAIICWNIEEIA